jgi:glycosyltransferase involved in cell wall biosynthesis
VNSEVPRVTLCLPVRNGQQSIRKALDSALSQDFQDLEVAISDNASDDETPEVLREYARRDSRLRVSTNPENVGLLENVNIAFRMARGEFVRLLGSDDWLEPQCISRCVEALEARPEAVGVTTGFRAHLDSGESVYEDYPGEMPDSPDPVRRLARMLWFYRSGDLLYDPMYAVWRREALDRSGLIRLMIDNDHMLTAELVLMGPILHLPEHLAHRAKSYPVSLEALLRRLHPILWKELDRGSLYSGSVLLSIVAQAGLTPWQFSRCLPLVGHFTANRVKRHYRRRYRQLRRRRELARKSHGEFPDGNSGRAS